MKTRSEGRGLKGGGQKYNVSNFIVLFQVIKVRYWKGKGKRKKNEERKGKESARKFRGKKERKKRKIRQE